MKFREDLILSKIDREKNPYNLEKVFNVAEKKKRIDRMDITDDDFKEHYGTQKIEESLAYVEDRKERFRKQDIEKGNLEKQEETNKKAKIFEVLLTEQIELSDFFGENAYTISASEYDDIKNGVDTIIEFIQDENYFAYLGLAIDITFANDLNKKIDRIKTNINKGCLAKVEYFKSDNNTSVIGALKELPRFVVGTDGHNLDKLILLWSKTFDKNLSSQERQGAKTELSKHPIQIDILKQIILQASTYLRYAKEKTKHENVENKMQSILNIFEKVYAEKIKEFKNEILPKNSKMYAQINSTLKDKFGFSVDKFI